MLHIATNHNNIKGAGFHNHTGAKPIDHVDDDQRHPVDGDTAAANLLTTPSSFSLSAYLSLRSLSISLTCTLSLSPRLPGSPWGL